MFLKTLFLGNRLVGTLLLYPSSLRKSASAIAPSLGATLKHCIDEGSWPTKWKMEEWTPLFRKEDVLLIIFAWKRRVINF